MNNEVIVIGELNADLLLNDIAEFPSIGKEILAQKMTLTLGSSSAIFASNLCSLGTGVTFTGSVGRDDFGAFCIECLNKANVETKYIKIDNENGTGLTVILNYGEDRAMVTCQGAMKYFSVKDIDFDQFKYSRHLHFSSYFLQPGIAPDIHVVFRKAKEMGLTVSFDPQWDPDEKWDLNLREVLPYVDVFLPNKKEFMALTGSDNWKEGLRSFKDHPNTIVIKDGNNGSYVFHNNETNYCPPFLNTDVVDAIGAGDSFNAGFIHQFVKGLSLIECQRYANLIGAISTTEAGGTGAFKDLKKVREIALYKFKFNNFQFS
jgi:sugar/nucleoside kinase (ribokinase family)